MLSGQWAAPLATADVQREITIDGLVPSVPLVVDAVAGELALDRLSADLARSGRPARWARLEPYDLDPAAMDALAGAVLAGVEVDAAPNGQWSVVVEAKNRPQATAFLTRLYAAQSTGPEPCVVVVRNVPATKTHGTSIPLRRRQKSTASVVEALERITERRPALRASVLDAGERLRPGELTSVVHDARTIDEVISRLAKRILEDLPSQIITALGLSALLGYGHRSFGALAPMMDSTIELPWWTELSDGWRRFEPTWRDGVRAIGRVDRRSEVSLLVQLVRELLEKGATSAALELCIDADYYGIASDLLVGLGPSLISSGRPHSVHRWLRRLPPTVRHRHRALAAQVRWARKSNTSALFTGHQSIEVHAIDVAGNLAPLPPRPADRPRAVSRPAHPKQGSVTLEVRLFGPMEVWIGGRPVERWHGRKGPLLLAYLLLQRRGRPVPRDALAVNLWPDVGSHAARNRLHVAVHTLRADLRTASTVPVVVFQNRGYTINPTLTMSLDTDEFERAAARGKHAEAERDTEQALAAYKSANKKYRADLLSEHPYDDWTLLPRERYRVQMLDVIGRQTQVAFDGGRFAEAIESGQRLLTLDFCREDIHRLLMRAYVHVGRIPLAIHQFRVCSGQVRRELNMAPAQETIELHERILARGDV